MGAKLPSYTLSLSTGRGEQRDPTIRDWMVRVQANAAFALASICRHNEANQSSVADLGGLPRLGLLLKPSGVAYGDDWKGPVAMVEAEAAGAIWSLSENHDANKVSIAGAQVIPTMTTLLASVNERAQKHAASALASLSLGKPDNQADVAALLVQVCGDAIGKPLRETSI